MASEEIRDSDDAINCPAAPSGPLLSLLLGGALATNGGFEWPLRPAAREWRYGCIHDTLGRDWLPLGGRPLRRTPFKHDGGGLRI